MAKYKIGSLFQTPIAVTQRYGVNSDYYKQFGLAGHEGVDFGTQNGTPFLSPFNGVILRDIFNDKSYGNFSVVWDSQQLCAVWFCHLQDVTTKVGDKVTKGQILGHTNNTGNSSGPHCHVNFVATDAQGNRLNKDNGYQGFLNILDTNLVEFDGAEAMAVISQAELDKMRHDRDTYYNENQDLQKAVITLNAKIKELGDNIALDAQNDHDLATKNLEIEHKLDEANSLITTHYKRFNVFTEGAYIIAVEGLLKPAKKVGDELAKTQDGLAEAAIAKTISNLPKRTLIQRIVSLFRK